MSLLLLLNQPSGTATNKTLTGASTPAGTVARRSLKSFIGAVTSSAINITMDAYISFTGAIASSGTVIKAVWKSFSGELINEGGSEVSKMLSGTVMFVGTLIRSFVQAKRTGAVTLSAINMTMDVYINFTGELINEGWNETLKTFAGAVTFVGTLLARSIRTRTIMGTLPPSGAVRKSSPRSFAGISTSTGRLVRGMVKTMTGVITSSGVFTRAMVIVRLLTGTVTIAGSVLKSTLKTILGSLGLSGDIDIFGGLSIMLSGGLTMAGTKAISMQRTLSGAVDATGILIRSLVTRFVGTITFIGGLFKSSYFARLFEGTVGSSGLIRFGLGLLMTFTGAVTTVGKLFLRDNSILLRFLSRIHLEFEQRITRLKFRPEETEDEDEGSWEV